MAEKMVYLTEEKELRIYMHPLRQKILRTMEHKGAPMTAKQLADTLKITPASAKHHILQLSSIGLVGIDHTEQIRGITATFYALLPVTVSLGLGKERQDEKRLLVENSFSQMLSGAFAVLNEVHSEGREANAEGFDGDITTGSIHMTPEEGLELYKKIREFIDSHRHASEDTVPYDFALALYAVKETEDKA